jgi:hypothetical protein
LTPPPAVSLRLRCRYCRALARSRWGAGGRGRYALTQAYRLAGVGSDAAILISAYHCRAMLDPAIRPGVPIWRWDDVAVSDCAVATHYRLHLR